MSNCKKKIQLAMLAKAIGNGILIYVTYDSQPMRIKLQLYWENEMSQY